jgi:hypothetical protein
MLSSCAGAVNENMCGLWIGLESGRSGVGGASEHARSAGGVASTVLP